uniref:Uncharacterized protein n=1 Tax=Meloidogyne hapla TaxID=6305 RepID=A0A1I8B2Z3_MELHA
MDTLEVDPSPPPYNVGTTTTATTRTTRGCNNVAREDCNCVSASELKMALERFRDYKRALVGQHVHHHVRLLIRTCCDRLRLQMPSRPSLWVFRCWNHLLNSLVGMSEAESLDVIANVHDSCKE